MKLYGFVEDIVPLQNGSFLVRNSPARGCGGVAIEGG
jgi:hypothetical protein